MKRSTDERIADLPSTRELSSLLPLVRATRALAGLALKTGLGGDKAQKVVECAEEVISQSDVLDLPDQFNSAFVDHGWIATSSLSVDVMRRALELKATGDEEAAEEAILDWLKPEIIEQFAIKRSKAFCKVSGRWEQLREALALTEEGRYWSAVPLILIACDGFASDVIGTSPFEKNADLALFDSIVGHSTSLPAAIGLVTKGVRKSSDEPLFLPLRHGILHGRSLGYANRLVCGKAWLLMISLVDWAADQRDEQQRRVDDEAKKSASWGDLVASLKKNQADKEALEAFVPHHWDGPFNDDLPGEEPPFAFREFLTAWQNKNYGLMAKRAVNITGQPHGRLAGRMRSDAQNIQLIEFEILSVGQNAVARAEAHVTLQGRTLNGEVCGTFKILGFRDTLDGNVAMPTDEGEWKVQQGCIFDLMNERTTDRQDRSS